MKTIYFPLGHLRTVTRANLTVIFATMLQFESIGMAAGPTIIDAQTAMRIAEEFVRANGYTDAPATKSVDQLDSESFERIPREQWSEARRGMLASSAYGYQRGARTDEQGWTVLFRIQRKPEFKASKQEMMYAKPVQMDRHGRQVIALHGIVNSLPRTPTFVGYTKRTDQSQR